MDQRECSRPSKGWGGSDAGLLSGDRVAAGMSLTKNLNSVRAGFAGTDTDDLLHRRDEDLTVTNLTGARCFSDGLYSLLHQTIVQCQLDFHLAYKMPDLFRPPLQ